MYKIKNGVLYQNGRPTLALGTSYYASYHPQKVTVPPEGDKYGEMRQDVRDIALAGFNHIRTCANGAAHWADDRFCLDTAFTDALVEEAAKNGLCSFVRIQGYSMNQRGHENAQPIDQRGEAGQTTGFVRDTLNHPALNRDTDAATRQQALHFAALPEMLGFQIFNEPAIYRAGGETHLYDYNPLTIAAFREWLVRKGYKTAEEAAGLEPPRAFPQPGETDALFSLWRQFGVENMSAMLCRLNARAREAAPGSESFTNFVATPLNGPHSSCEGDWFACAQGMDILGLDIYTPQRGEDYYSVAQRLDEVESAAAAQGKHAWIIEYCCRTHMTVQDYEGEAYAALGSGYKGINYYLWRADLGGPEVQLGGMIWNNRSKTAKFDEAVRFNHMLLREGEKLAVCEKLRDGVGILYSLHGAAQCEAAQGGGNRWYQSVHARYAALKKAGITADFIQAEDLARNPLGIRLLFVPWLDALDEKERAQVAAFAREHAVVLESNAFHPACGETVNGVSVVSNWCYRPAGTEGGSDEKIRARFRLPELLRIAGIHPVLRAVADDASLGFGFLKGQGESAPDYVACLVNIQTNAAPARNGRLYFDEARTGEILRAEYVDRLGTRALPIRREDGRAFVSLPDLEQTGGCLVYLYSK